MSGPPQLSADRSPGKLYLGGLAALEAALAEEVVAAKRHDALAPVTIVVGSSAAGAGILRALARRLGGHGNVRAVTIYRLAAELAAAGGLRTERVLSDEARLRLMESILRGIAGRTGSRLARIVGMPGTAHAVLRSLDDLREAGVPAREGWGRPVGVLAELRAALEAYEAALGTAGGVDRAAVYAAALTSLAGDQPALEAALPGGSVILVYGIYDLPQCQRILLAALAHRHPFSAFVPFPERGQDYARLGLEFFATLGLGPVELPAGEGPRAELVSVGDDEDEAFEAARVIRELVRGGVSCHEIAVVAPGERRAHEVARTLLALQLPVARRLPAAGGAAGRLAGLLAAAFPAAGSPWSRAAVIEYAISLTAEPARRLDEVMVARWTDESRQAGVVAGDDWQRLAGHQRRLAARAAALRAGGDGDEEPAAAGALELCERRLAASGSLESFVNELRMAVAALPERADWARMIEVAGGIAAAQCGATRDDPAIEALRELRACGLVEREVSAAEFAGCARERLSRLTEAHGAVGRSGVAVLTPHELRGLRFSAVLFTGLCSGGFPAAGAHDPILSDTARRELAQRFGVPLAELGLREREADLLFALAQESAEQRFVAFVPRLDAAGGSRQPSRIAVELAEGITGAVITADDIVRAPLTGASLRRVPGGAQAAALLADGPALPGGRSPVDLRELDVGLLLALDTAGGPGSAPRATGARRGYLQAVCGAGAARRLLGRRTAAVSPAPLAWDGVFRAPAARRALASAGLFDGPQAPTALQEYVRCPFGYYVLSVLGIEPVEEPEALVEADRREVGLVVHRVLQRVYAAVCDGADERQAVAMVAGITAAECGAAERRGGVGLPVVWRTLQAQLAEDLGCAVAEDPCWTQPGGPRPWKLELPFGGGDAPVVLALGDGDEVRFAGRIDRLDRSPDGRRFRVLDYKTGKGKAEKEQVEAGRNIQLPVYLLAARHLLEPSAQAAVECSFRMVTRRREVDEVPLPADEAAVLADLGETVKSIKQLVGDGMFPRLPAGSRGCDWCDLAYGCDELTATRERKRSHPRMARVCALRRPVAETRAIADAAGFTPDAPDGERGDA